MKSKGYEGNGPAFWGEAEDLLITSTVLQIPLVCVGPLPSVVPLSGSFHNLYVYISDPKAASITVDVNDITQSARLGSFTITAGNLTATKNVGSAFSITFDDNVVIELSVASGELYVPNFIWFT